MVGTKISLELGGQTVASYICNFLRNDGQLGRLVQGDTSLFDSLTLWGDDQDGEIFSEIGGSDLANLLAQAYNHTYAINWIVDEEEG